MAKTKKDSKPKASKRSSEEPSSKSSATMATAVSPTPKTKKRGFDSHAASSHQGTAAYQTPQKKSRRVKQVTPGTPPAVSTKETKKEYVPTYIHKNVEYLRKGSAELDKRTLQVFELVQKYFVVPDDFEQSRGYGPLSGTCFEERVISAYALNLLEPRDSDEKDAAAIKICTHCANEGHKRDQCVELI